MNAVRPEGAHTADVGQWHGIIIPAVREGTLLRDYLAGPLTGKSKRAIEVVVSSLLVAPANQSVDATKDEIPYGFSLGSAAQIWSSLDEVTSWGAITRKQDCKFAETIKRTVLDAAEGKLSFSRFKKLALLHGDFHCRNVFVSELGMPVLIDFGRSEVYPRMFDFAAMDADLIFSVLDGQSSRDLRFGTNIDRWLKQVTSRYPFKSRTNGEGDTRAAYLLHMLHKHAMSSVADANDTEYAEALAFHAARYLRFPTTTAPKKLLAVRVLGILLNELGF